MGYTFTIGNMRVTYDNNEVDPRVRVEADRLMQTNAPAFGEPSDYISSRCPSYSAWADFCRFVGLYDLFYGKNEQGEYTRDDALLYSHPGCIPLTEKHRQEVNAAYAAFKIKYPNAIATYGNRPAGIKGFIEGDPDNPEENRQLCRLEWLHYWINWALDNCDKPVFENS